MCHHHEWFLKYKKRNILALNFFQFRESQRQWRTVGHDNSTYYQKAETQQALWPNGMQTCEITEVQSTQKAQTISTPDDEQLT